MSKAERARLAPRLAGTLRHMTKQADKLAPRTAVQGKVEYPLPASMQAGRASAAKAAVGDQPVFDYIGGLPEPQRSIAERVDALAAKTLPNLQRATSLTPVPPVTPIGMGKESRGVDLESVDAIDERQLASWMQQAAALPGFGKR
jgi:hypothetical protein